MARANGPRDGGRWRALTVVLLAVGVALRLWQYAANTSFWLDEISIARNVVADQPLRTLLFQPLAFEQVAPKGFLLAEWLAVAALGPTELALRLFPLLCGIAGMFLFALVAGRTLDRRAAVVALTTFVLALPLIRYSAEAKQYGADVAASLVLTLGALDLGRRERPSVGRCAAWGLAGVALVTFSQAAVLVMAALGALLVARWLLARGDDDRRSRRHPALVTVPIWGAAALAALVVAKRSMTPETDAFMHAFWRDGFLPRPVTVASAAHWIASRPLELLAHGTMLRYPLPWVYSVLVLVGVVALWRRNRWTALVVTAPAVVTLGAAIARQYPFDRRLILFLLPALLLAIAAAADWLATTVARRWRIPAAATFAAVLLGPTYAFATTPPPYRTEEYRPVFRYLQARRRPGDAVLVFRSAGAGAAFYGPRYGLRRGDYVLGGCDRDSLHVFLRDVDRFRGVRRLWVVESSVRTYRPARRAFDTYLATIGVRREGIAVRTPLQDSVSVALFDLSDPQRLRATPAADAFPVATAVPDSLRATCRSMMLPSRLDR
ncbi:MAG TPA: hypothetical protein VFJ74_04145 [Gemmatimonadaceae bacterium]|nr:hypothetical protein [Gemmatimonadaceae bacterium]